MILLLFGMVFEFGKGIWLRIFFRRMMDLSFWCFNLIGGIFCRLRVWEVLVSRVLVFVVFWVMFLFMDKLGLDLFFW